MASTPKLVYLIRLCCKVEIIKYHIISQWSSSGPVNVLLSVSVLRVDGAI